MPYNHFTENHRNKGNDNAIYHKAADNIQCNRLTRTLRRIEICRDHGIDTANDKTLAVFPHMNLYKGNVLCISTKQFLHTLYPVQQKYYQRQKIKIHKHWRESQVLHFEK